MQEVVPPKLLTPSPDYCTYPNCNKPLRGAVEMYLSDFGTPGCSAGFVGYTTTTWVMFTAGHCVAYSDPVWWGYNAYNGHWLRIGRHVGWDYGTPGDSGTVGTFGSPSPCDWCPDVTTPIIAAWTVSETYPIHYRWFPYTGLYLCRLGATTPISCGYVQETNVTRGYSDGTIVSGLFRTDACSAGGDSGGPYVANYIAIGLHSASTGSCSGSSETYGIEILNAETRIGARVHTYY